MCNICTSPNKKTSLFLPLPFSLQTAQSAVWTEALKTEEEKTALCWDLFDFLYMNAIEQRSMRVINIHADVWTYIYDIYIWRRPHVSLLARLYWLSIDLPFTPLAEELLGFIFLTAQVKELFHSVCMHTFISRCEHVWVCVRVAAWVVLDVSTRATTYSGFYSHSAPSWMILPLH